jgi:hypothetical protein
VRKTTSPEAKSLRIVRSLNKCINRGRNKAAFFRFDERAHVARTDLIQANSSANEYLSELNVVVLLRSATRYA